MYDEIAKTPASVSGSQIRQDTVLERLQRDKQGLESRLKDVNNCIELLEKNPEVSKILQALSKVTHI